MNKFTFIIFFMLSACTSTQLPKFETGKVCSDRAQKYLTSAFTRRPIPSAELAPKLETILPELKTCYKDEWPDFQSIPVIHLCLVAGYDSTGKQEFFDFSTKEMQLPEDFQKCLNNLRGHSSLKGFKDAKILQPMNFNALTIK